MWFIDLVVQAGPGVFAVLLFGAVTLLTAAWFAWRAEGRVRRFIDDMGKVILFATLTSLSVDVAKVLDLANRQPEQRGALLLAGLAESIAAPILGFAVLAMVYFLTAIGQRRLDARRS